MSVNVFLIPEYGFYYCPLLDIKSSEQGLCVYSIFTTCTLCIPVPSHCYLYLCVHLCTVWCKIFGCSLLPRLPILVHWRLHAITFQVT